MTFESDWSPCFGDPLWKALEHGSVEEERLNMGCVAAHGHFVWGKDAGRYGFVEEGKPGTAFLFKLISMLQFSGTVPMIDVNAYAEWLTK